MKLCINQLLTRQVENYFFLLIEHTERQCVNRIFALFHEGTFGFLHDLHKLQQMLKETLNCHCITFKVKFKQETQLYKEINFFRKKCPETHQL